METDSAKKRQTALPTVTYSSTQNSLKILKLPSVIQSQPNLVTANTNRIPLPNYKDRRKTTLTTTLAAIHEESPPTPRITDLEDDGIRSMSESLQQASTILNEARPKFSRIVDPMKAYKWLSTLTTQTDCSALASGSDGVPVTILKLKDGSSMDIIRQFLTAERTDNATHCRNVMNLIEIMIHEDCFFLVREHVPITLFEMLSSPAVVVGLTEKELAVIASGALNGIRFLNALGLQHGRIGRSNIGFSRDGVIKLKGCEQCRQVVSANKAPLWEQQINHDVNAVGVMIRDIMHLIQKKHECEWSDGLDMFCSATKYASGSEIVELDFLRSHQNVPFPIALVELAQLTAFRIWTLAPKTATELGS